MNKPRTHRLMNAISVAVVLALGWVLLLPQSQTQAGTPDDSYTIERYYNEYTSQQQTDSTTFVDAVTVTFTPPTSKDYLVIVSALTNNDSTAYSTVVQLVEDTTSYSETYHKPVDASLNWRSFGAHKVFSLTGSTPYTFKIQYRTELGDSTATAYIQRAAITVVEVSNYYNGEQETEIGTTSTTYVDAGTATITFTPPTQADYLILLTANVITSTSGKSTFVQWTIDGTPDSEFQQPGTTYMSWGAMEQENLTAVSHTITIQYHSESPATAYIKSVRVTAVLLSDLGVKEYAESETESFTSSITYVDKTTLAFTPSTRGDYMVIVSGLGRQENKSYAFFASKDEDGTSHGEYIFVPGSEQHYRSFMIMSKTNFSAAPHTIKIQWRTNNPAANSEAFIKTANAIAIKIDAAESYNDSAHTTVDDNFTTGENTAYTWAHGLRPSGDTTYRVAYYDGDVTGGGQKVATDLSPTLTAYGNLSSQYLLTTDLGATAGTWHAVVFDEEFIPAEGAPTDYNQAAITAGYVVEDSFTVTDAAIPEFPTVIAGIVVAGMCFGIYYWMRKRRLAHVKA